MKTLGVLGGMGPLASAEFLTTLYAMNPAEPEQEAPKCILYSDPSFPDRTEAILQGDTGALTESLTRGLAALMELGAERTIVACITIHHLLSEISAELRAPVISLVDLTIDEILRNPRPILLLCTTGTRLVGVFERHPRWHLVQDCVTYLDEADQRNLHQRIYRIKASEPLAECLSWLDALPARYGLEEFVFGCTELHIVHKERFRRKGYFDSRVVDPLLIAARDLPRFLGDKSRT